jgi:hypothetical protein
MIAWMNTPWITVIAGGALITEVEPRPNIAGVA